MPREVANGIGKALPHSIQAREGRELFFLEKK